MVVVKWRPPPPFGPHSLFYLLSHKIAVVFSFILQLHFHLFLTQIHKESRHNALPKLPIHPKMATAAEGTNPGGPPPPCESPQEKQEKTEQPNPRESNDGHDKHQAESASSKVGGAPADSLRKAGEEGDMEAEMKAEDRDERPENDTGSDDDEEAASEAADIEKRETIDAFHSFLRV